MTIHATNAQGVVVDSMTSEWGFALLLYWARLQKQIGCTLVAGAN